ncbi:transporter substrate-binding domain-containing protein [Marinobacter salinisoli]|uniref:Transporter substrate-binding domain-containing protein n=1 Tax=Marinobacter salinisoli TaxID=2769486 RepID=A0ABX7MTJ6_9GAMM|nr:transporter substrate-binding domain-containing protein [Marinobacter salinisoli]QSP95700.1 transporter substrate-binding domain-containing protein [Marinobacter salinisoli]
MSVSRQYLCKLALLAAFLLDGSLSMAHADTVITFGAYHFPPIADVDHNKQPRGLLGDLIPALEAAHDDLDIRIFHTSPKRRYLDFEAGLYDVILFESADWGWATRAASISEPILVEEEVYVALDKPGRGQSFFDDIASRSIIAMSGYHYGFADRETDPEELQKRFKIEFSDNHNRSLQLIKADRPSVAEITIINRSFLHNHWSQKNGTGPSLLISEKPDQRYVLRIVARKDSPLTAAQVFGLLRPLIADGSYAELVSKWGLQLPDNLAGQRAAVSGRPE